MGAKMLARVRGAVMGLRVALAVGKKHIIEYLQVRGCDLLSLTRVFVALGTAASLLHIR